MKQKLNKVLLTFLVAFSFGLAAIPAESMAYQCGWVPGHWQRGYWVAGHRVCWGGGYFSPYRYYGRCWVVPGHWRYGSWIPAHRVCG